MNKACMKLESPYSSSDVLSSLLSMSEELAQVLNTCDSIITQSVLSEEDEESLRMIYDSIKSNLDALFQLQSRSINHEESELELLYDDCEDYYD